jgi:hypothetical protein
MVPTIENLAHMQGRKEPGPSHDKLTKSSRYATCRKYRTRACVAKLISNRSVVQSNLFRTKSNTNLRSHLGRFVPVLGQLNTDDESMLG